MGFDVKNFLLEKFWVPIVNESVYYNPYNTIAYAAIFGALTVYVIYPLIQKMDIEIDKEFIKGFIPFIMFGGALRALKDINAVNSLILVTPFIYIVLITAGLASLIVSREIEKQKGIGYHKTLSSIGFLLLAVSLSFYSIKNFQAILLEGTLILIWSSIGFLILKAFKPELLKFEFTAPVAAHYLDASSTFTALSFGANEKHVIGRIFIDLMGPTGMFVMKTMVIVPASYYLVEEFEGEEKMFYIFLITALGLGIAMRNTLQTIGTVP
ncbi:MAG: DUF63 family protein [Candidatus Nanosalina sp.]